MKKVLDIIAISLYNVFRKEVRQVVEQIKKFSEVIVALTELALKFGTLIAVIRMIVSTFF